MLGLGNVGHQRADARLVTEVDARTLNRCGNASKGVFDGRAESSARAGHGGGDHSNRVVDLVASLLDCCTIGIARIYGRDRIVRRKIDRRGQAKVGQDLLLCRRIADERSLISVVSGVMTEEP